MARQRPPTAQAWVIFVHLACIRAMRPASQSKNTDLLAEGSDEKQTGPSNGTPWLGGGDAGEDSATQADGTGASLSARHTAHSTIDGLQVTVGGFVVPHRPRTWHMPRPAHFHRHGEGEDDEVAAAGQLDAVGQPAAGSEHLAADDADRVQALDERSNMSLSAAAVAAQVGSEPGSSNLGAAANTESSSNLVAAADVEGTAPSPEGETFATHRDAEQHAAGAPVHTSGEPPLGKSLEGTGTVTSRMEADRDALMQHRSMSMLALTQDRLYALGGGIHARLSSKGLLFFEHSGSSLRLQKEAVLCLFVLVYFAALLISTQLVYRKSRSHSPATFVADPRLHTASVNTFDLDTFLEAFNSSPKGAYLKVTGYTPASQDGPSSLRWRGRSYHVDFSISLDISPWMRRGPPSPLEVRQVRSDGIVAADAATLLQLLQAREQGSCMAVVDLQKDVVWANWEELATNIKHHIRQGGFNGVIVIDRTEQESMCIYRNTQWANFMHSRSLQVILGLSIVGWPLYALWRRLRCTRLPVRCLYNIDIGIGDCWPLIERDIQATQQQRVGNGAGGTASEETSSTSDSTESAR